MTKISALVCMLALLAFAGNLYAYSFSLNPGVGIIDNTGLYYATIDIVLNNDLGTIYIDAAEFELDLDITELDPRGISKTWPGVNWMPGLLDVTPWPGHSTSPFTITGLASSYVTIPNGSTTIASVGFMFKNPISVPGPADGTDVILRASGQYQGIHDYYGTFDVNGYLEVESDIAGPDYGVVPIPGPVWLFVSGLIGVLGFSRKFRK